MTAEEFRAVQAARWWWVNFAAIWSIIAHVEIEIRKSEFAHG